jgi:hypothetical protein
MGGELLETVVGLRDAKTSVVMIGLPDGQMNLELIKYHTPTDKRDIQPTACAPSLVPRFVARAFGGG